ncbi:MAG: stomatin-like protein [bacterium]
MQWIVGVLFFFAFYVMVKSIRVVPQKTAYIVERWGRYRCTLDAGLHVLMPIMDQVAYKHTLKEVAIDVPPQQCITKDNITVEVDGVLYMMVMDPVRASYGISNYMFATVQISQTTMRSEVGKLELDRTFEERERINGAIVDAVDKASEPWGIKVTRYEVKNISPPQTIRDAMEKQMRAEREKRALIAESEGDRQARINRADGEKQQAIAFSEGEKQKRINEAQGRAQEIMLVANATASGLREISKACMEPGGTNAINLRLAEQYITEFGRLAKVGNSMIIPADLANVAGFIKAAASVVKDLPAGSVANTAATSMPPKLG